MTTPKLTRTADVLAILSAGGWVEVRQPRGGYPHPLMILRSADSSEVTAWMTALHRALRECEKVDHRMSDRGVMVDVWRIRREAAA